MPKYLNEAAMQDEYSQKDFMLAATVTAEGARLLLSVALLIFTLLLSIASGRLLKPHC